MNISISYAAPTLDAFLTAIQAVQGIPSLASTAIAPTYAGTPGAAPRAKHASKHPVELAYNADSFRPDGTRYREGKKFTVAQADCNAVGWTGDRGAMPELQRLRAIATRLVMEGMPVEEVQAIIDASPDVPDDSPAPVQGTAPVEDIDESDI